MNSWISRAVVVALTMMAAATQSSADSGRPDHLEPIQKHEGVLAEYDQIVHKSLIRDSQPELWMLVKPSFTPEYSLLLRKVKEADTVVSHYALEYAICNKKIWAYQKLTKGNPELELNSYVTVTRREADIPNELADEVINVWKHTISLTKPAVKDWVGADGTTYEFFVAPDHYGQTWSPDSGMPRMLVDLGALMIEYVTSPDKKRGDVAKRISKLTSELRNRVESQKP